MGRRFCNYLYKSVVYILDKCTVTLIPTRHIGKEANDLERQAYVGLEPDAVPAYGISGIDRCELVKAVKALVGAIGMPKTVKALATNATRLRRFMAGKLSRSDNALLQSIAVRLPVAHAIAERISFKRQADLQALREVIARDGHNATAKRLEKDPANLRRMLRTG
ncbi:MAG: hypothetical protein ABIO86_11455 [Sphingomonas sp.]